MSRNSCQAFGEFNEQLAREIRDDLSGIVAFEAAHNMYPWFLQYYKHWTADGTRLRRTRNGAILRRQDLPAFVERLQESFGPHPRVLDVGCGYASDALLLTRLGCEVVGVDSSEDAILVSTHRALQWRPFLGEHAPVPRFLAGRLEDVPALEPGSFHGVFSSECLHHCEPVENTLLAIRGLVNARGRVLVLESNGGSPANRIMLSRLRAPTATRVLSEKDGRYYLYGDENVRGARAWRRLFNDCGFEVDRMRYSRHALSELTIASPEMDAALCSIPGASLAAIHLTFELTPRFP